MYFKIYLPPIFANLLKHFWRFGSNKTLDENLGSVLCSSLVQKIELWKIFKTCDAKTFYARNYVKINKKSHAYLKTICIT